MRTDLQQAIFRSQLARQTPIAVMARPMPEPPPLRIVEPVIVSVATKPIRIVPDPVRIVPLNRLSKVRCVIKAACQHFWVSHAELVGCDRTASLVYPRHVAIHVCRKFINNISLPEIGREFGGRDHTSILHAYSRIEKRLEDPRVAADCAELARAISEVI